MQQKSATIIVPSTNASSSLFFFLIAAIVVIIVVSSRKICFLLLSLFKLQSGRVLCFLYVCVFFYYFIMSKRCTKNNFTYTLKLYKIFVSRVVPVFRGTCIVVLCQTVNKFQSALVTFYIIANASCRLIDINKI
uniref:Putative conserved plasma membrane protein n=1 Tax=Ixodes ricinus TaxID=34613 RepID=A0A090XBB6_IXORI